jgi:hypothetical protein
MRSARVPNWHARAEQRAGVSLPLAMAGLGLLVSGVGCDKIHEATISSESTAEQPVFLLRAKSIWSDDVCIYRFAVYGQPISVPATADAPPSLRTAWEFAAKEGGCANVRQVRYGLVPEGFVTVTGPEPLTDGWVYRADIGYRGVGPDPAVDITRDATGARQLRSLTDDEWRCLVPHPVFGRRCSGPDALTTSGRP